MRTGPWNLAKYSKMCRDVRRGLEEDYGGVSEDMFFDLAQSLLENEEGLEEWIRDKLLKAAERPDDVKGCLVDDLAYPGNCRGYVGRVK